MGSGAVALIALAVAIVAILRILIALGSVKFHAREARTEKIVDLAAFCTTPVDEIWWERQNQLLQRCNL